MDFDDNFDASSPKNNKEKRKLSHSNSSSSGDLDHPDKIVETVLKRLGQTYRPPYRPIAPTPSLVVGPYMCGILQNHTNAHHIFQGQTNLLPDVGVKCVARMQHMSQGAVDTLIVWLETGTMLGKATRSPINKTTKVGMYKTIHTKK